MCWALSSSDTAPVMIALEAEVTLVGPDGERRIPVAELYGRDGIHYLAKRPDEILTEIHVPDRSGWRVTYRKLRRRGSIDFPILGVAAAVRLARGRGGGGADRAGGRAHAPRGGDGRGGISARASASTRRRSRWRPGSPTSRPSPSTTPTSSYAWRKRMARIEVARALRELAGLPTGDLPPVVI